MILHIFRKDARRLWPHILVTLILLAALAHYDRHRDDWLAGSTEAWLNLLVPLAWACLIGLVVEQEPLVGDRQFWNTRPYRRGVLFAAKALFVLLFIHLPYFTASAWILAARGFSPIEHLPQLLWSQVLLAAALTLPAMALASLVRSFTHFILELVAVAALLIFLSGAFAAQGPRWPTVESVRRGIAILVAGAAALAIIWIQYRDRRPMLARGLGVAAAALAGGLFSWLLPQSAFALRSAMVPVSAALTMRLSSHGGEPYRGVAGGPANRITLAIPIEISGLPESLGFHLESIEAQATAPNGDRYNAGTPYTNRTLPNPFSDAGIWPYGPNRNDPLWLILRFNRSTFDRQMRSGKSRVTGSLGATFFRLGEATWLPVGVRQQAAGIGLCATILVSAPWNEDRLKVECESPSSLPLTTRVRAWHRETGDEWPDRFGRPYPYAEVARQWLSALDRRQSSFMIAPPGTKRVPGGRWAIPAEVVESVRIELIPEHLAGYSVLHYDLQNLDLARYIFAP